MLVRELIGTAQVPGGEELRLYTHGTDFIIALDRNELMSTRMRYSEEALATLTLERMVDPAPHLLVGGYGMGFTLRAALGLLGPQGRITVAELVPEIIEWARGPMAAVANGCLEDPRVALQMGDVGESIAAANGTFDAILLDVDNGPDGLVRDANNWLYSMKGLKAAMRALRPGGVLAVWSGASDKAFTRRLNEAKFDVEEITVRARPNNKGPRHTIWFAHKP
jgi:spermidine synthase